MRRPLAPGMRVHTRFWNEVTEANYGRGADNPFIRAATVLSVGGGRVHLAFDPAPPDDERFEPASKYSGAYEHTVPAYTVHRGEPTDGPDPALVWREHTWGRPWALSEHAKFRFSWSHITWREWLRRKRDFQLRYNDPAIARARVAKAAKARAAEKRHFAFLAEQLRTPMTFPPFHPGLCGEPIYPMLNAAGDGLGDGYRCRTHGDVTEQVMATFYKQGHPA